MSQKLVDRFREGSEVLARGDIDGWLSYFDPDVVFEPQAAQFEGAFAGHDGARAFMASVGDLYETFEVDLTDVRDCGDRVLGLGTMKTVAKGSGIEQETPVAIVSTYRGGLVTHFKDYGDKEQALKAVGLSE